jgi:cell division septum initiation protein DivIVA
MSRDTGKRLDPVEIQHVELRHRIFGYRRRDVDELLETVTASFEEAWYEREALRERVESLLGDVERARERDRLVGDVVRNAQRVADQVIADARETAEGLLAKARRRSHDLVANAQRDPERLREEIRSLSKAERELHERFRSFCSLARDVLDEGSADDNGAVPDSRSAIVDVPEQDPAPSSA